MADTSTSINRDFLTIDKRFLSTLHVDQKHFISPTLVLYVVETTRKTYKMLLARGPTGVLASFLNAWAYKCTLQLYSAALMDISSRNTGVD